MKVRICETERGCTGRTRGCYYLLMKWREIILRGPTMMAGIIIVKNRIKKIDYKGWYHSGHLGYFDKDGYYRSDRVDTMVIKRWRNIYPREIEDFIHSHPGILIGAYVGEPGMNFMARRVVAVIVEERWKQNRSWFRNVLPKNDELSRL